MDRVMTGASICEGLRQGSGDSRLLGVREIFLVYDPYVYCLLVSDVRWLDQWQTHCNDKRRVNECRCDIGTGLIPLSSLSENHSRVAAMSTFCDRSSLPGQDCGLDPHAKPIPPDPHAAAPTSSAPRPPDHTSATSRSSVRCTKSARWPGLSWPIWPSTRSNRAGVSVAIVSASASGTL